MKEILSIFFSLVGFAIIAFLIFHSVVYTYGAVKNYFEAYHVEVAEKTVQLEATSIGMDEQIELATKCTNAGLSVHYDYVFHNRKQYITDVMCGHSVAQQQADPGMTTGEGIVAGAAVVGGGIILNSMLK